MAETRNIQISIALFKKIVLLFEQMALRQHEVPVAFDFDRVLAELRDKQRRINLHTAYTNAIIAIDDGQKELAYSNYQKLKQRYMKK